MASSEPRLNRVELESARGVLHVLLTDPNTKEIFGAPVPDIPGYKALIKETRDLGTILRQLEESLGATEGAPKYSNAEAVLRDLDLVWSNCLLFNGPDDPISRICRSSSKLCVREWKKAGLRITPPAGAGLQAAGGARSGGRRPSGAMPRQIARLGPSIARPAAPAARRRRRRRSPAARSPTLRQVLRSPISRSA
jgi:bromodomain-containing factor 1